MDKQKKSQQKNKQSSNQMIDKTIQLDDLINKSSIKQNYIDKKQDDIQQNKIEDNRQDKKQDINKSNDKEIILSSEENILNQSSDQSDDQYIDESSENFEEEVEKETEKETEDENFELKDFEEKELSEKSELSEHSIEQVDEILQKTDVQDEDEQSYVSDKQNDCIFDYDDVNIFESEQKQQPQRISDEDRITDNRLFEYERVRIISTRTAQISQGAKIFFKYNGQPSAHELARIELQLKMTPLIIKRIIPSGKYELFKINELNIIDDDTIMKYIIKK